MYVSPISIGEWEATEFNANERKIRVRISIIPSVHGVKLAMRLLYHPLLDEIDASSKKPI